MGRVYNWLTEEEKGIIQKLRDKKMTIGQIAVEVGVDKTTVWRHVRNKPMLPPRARPRSFNHQEIRQLLDDGFMVKEIAYRVGCGETLVRNIKKRMVDGSDHSDSSASGGDVVEMGTSK